MFIIENSSIDMVVFKVFLNSIVTKQLNGNYLDKSNWRFHT